MQHTQGLLTGLDLTPEYAIKALCKTHKQDSGQVSSKHELMPLLQSVYLLSIGRSCPLLSTTEEWQICEWPIGYGRCSRSWIGPAAADEAAMAPAGV